MYILLSFALFTRYLVLPILRRLLCCILLFSLSVAWRVSAMPHSIMFAVAILLVKASVHNRIE